MTPTEFFIGFCIFWTLLLLALIVIDKATSLD